MAKTTKQQKVISKADFAVKPWRYGKNAELKVSDVSIDVHWRDSEGKASVTFANHRLTGLSIDEARRVAQAILEAANLAEDWMNETA